nr:MAG TPA: hypothetical protein [Caudoviricetes sp.]
MIVRGAFGHVVYARVRRGATVRPIGARRLAQVRAIKSSRDWIRTSNRPIMRMCRSGVGSLALVAA